MRGKNYTAEEDARIIKLIADNPNKRYIDIARMAIANGAISRPEGPLSDRVSYLAKKMMSPQVIEEAATQVQMVIQNASEGKRVTGGQRLNIALRRDVYEFVSVVSGCCGMGMTEFINAVITKYMNENMSIYVAIKTIRRQFDFE